MTAFEYELEDGSGVFELEDLSGNFDVNTHLNREITDIPNVRLWFDAADVAVDGDVATVASKVGSSNAAQGTATKRPDKTTIAGQPAFDFDPVTQDYFTLDGDALTMTRAASGITLYTVDYATDNTSIDRRFISFLTSGGTVRFGAQRMITTGNAAVLSRQLDADSATTSNSGSPVPTSTWQLHKFERNWQRGTNHASRNGTTILAHTTAGTAGPSSDTNAGFVFWGATNNSGGGHWSGAFRMLVAVGRVVTAEEDAFLTSCIQDITDAFSASNYVPTGFPNTIALGRPVESHVVSGMDRLVRFRQALAARATTPLRIMLMGDSRTEGEGATTLANRWQDRLAAAMRAKYPTAGVTTYAPHNYVPLKYLAPTLIGLAEWTAVTTASDPNNYGPGNRVSILSASGHGGTLTFTGTSFKLAYAKNTTASSFTYTVDGGSPVTVNVGTAASIEDGFTVDVTGLSATSHTVVVAWASGSVYFAGAYFFNGEEAAGIQVFDFAKYGVLASQLKGAGGDTSLTANVAKVDPQLVILDVGTNDYNTNVNPATYKTEVLARIAAIKAGCTVKPTIVLTLTWRARVPSPTYPWIQYQNALREIAAADFTCVIFDLESKWPLESDNSLGFYTAGGFHETNTGQGSRSRFIQEFLGALALDPPSVTDTARPIAAVKSSPALNIPVGQAVETDLAQPAARSKARTLGQPAGASTAQPVTRRKTGTLGQPAGASTAQPVAARKSRMAGQAAEGDLTLSVARRKTRSLALPAEADLTQPVTRRRSRTLAQPAAAEVAQPVGRTKLRAAGQTSEADIPQPVTQGIKVAVAQATETDLAQPVVRLKRRATAQALEDGLAQAAGRRKTRFASTNLLTPNQASVETDANGFVPIDANTAIARSTTRSIDGAASLSMVPAVASLWEFWSIASDVGSVTPGRTYSCEVSAYVTAGLRRVNPVMTFYDSSGVLVGTIDATAGNGYGTSSNNWTRITAQGVAPASASYVELHVSRGGGFWSNGETAWFDNFGVYEGPLPSSWVVPRTGPAEADLAQPVTRGTNEQQVAVAQATETDAPTAATVRRSRALAQAVETDTPQPTARAKRRATGQPSAADTAQPVARTKRRAAAQPAETDTPQAIARSKRRTAAQNTETDAPLAATRRKARAAGQTSEADSPLAASRSKRRVALQTTEVDTAQAAARAKRKAAGQAVEADVPQPVGDARGLMQTTEADLAQPVTVRLRRYVAVGQAAETGTSLRLATRVAAGRNTEADLAQAVARRKARATTQPAEADAPLPIGRAKLRTAGQPTEADSAGALARSKTRAVAEPAEADVAQPVARRKARTAGQVVETDLAQPVVRRKSAPAGQASELDAVGGTARSKRRTAVQAMEADVAQATARLKRKALAQATETDTPQPVGDARALTQNTETDSARPVGVHLRRYVAVGQATEADTATRLSTRVVAGRVIEADLAQPVTVRLGRRVVASQATEADTALLVGRSKRRTTGQATEADTVQPVSRRHSRALAQATETDATFPAARAKRRATGQPSEADTAQATSRAKRRTAAQATEADTAQAVSRAKRRALGQTSEADSPQPVGDARHLSQATEADQATALTARFRRYVPVGAATETDLAPGFSGTWAVGQAESANTALSLTKRKARPVAAVAETDLAPPATARHSRTVAQATETDLAQPAARSKTRATGQAQETDLGLPAQHRKARAAGQAAETDSSQATAAAKRKALGQPTETDAVQPAARSKRRTLGQTSETSVPQPVGDARSVGQAVEADQAMPIVPMGNRYVQVGQANEADTARRLARRVPAAQATETSTARPVASRKTVPTGTATETPAAFPAARAKRRATGQAAETELPLTARAAKRRALGQATEADSAQVATPGRRRVLGQATESDTAHAALPPKKIAVGRAAEVDQAQPVGAATHNFLPVGTAVEAGAVGAVGVRRAYRPGTPSEVEQAFAAGARKLRLIGAAFESDTAQVFLVPQVPADVVTSAADGVVTSASRRSSVRTGASPVRVRTQAT